MLPCRLPRVLVYNTRSILLLAAISVVSGITFTQQPVNSNVLLGEVVACCCEYTGVNTLPYWNLSGVLFPASEVPPHYTVNSTGLFFIATPEVNNTYYQCLFGSEAAAASSIGRVLITQDPGNDEAEASCNCSAYLVGVNIGLSQMSSEFIVMFKGINCSYDQYYCFGYGDGNEDCYLVANASENQRHKFPTPRIIHNHTIFLYIQDGYRYNCPNSTWIFNTSQTDILRYERGSEIKIPLIDRPCCNPSHSIVFSDNTRISWTGLDVDMKLGPYGYYRCNERCFNSTTPKCDQQCDICHNGSSNTNLFQSLYSVTCSDKDTPRGQVELDVSIILGHQQQEAPICFRNLTSPQNGSVTYNDTTEADYQCLSGFVLDGDNKRMCDLEGLWSGDSPNCSRNLDSKKNQIKIIIGVCVAVPIGLIIMIVGIISCIGVIVYCHKTRYRHHPINNDRPV